MSIHKLIQIPDYEIFDTVTYECDSITGLINKCFNIPEDRKHWSYLYLFKTSDKFRVNDIDSWATFSIRYPGRTLGHITCNGYGEIIESEYYNSENDIAEDRKNFNNIFSIIKNSKIDLLVLHEIQFVQSSLKQEPKADKKILYFIANFLYNQGIDNADVIHDQFRAGYCLHFAMILKGMFKGGEICWCAPFGHMVYMINDVPYDIEGVNDSECDYYIPISFVRDGLRDFTHIPGDCFNASQEYIDDAIQRYTMYRMYNQDQKNAEYETVRGDDNNG